MNTEYLKENYTDSKSIQWLQNLAKNKNAALYTSLIIEENDKVYNRGVFVYPDGTIDSYDKRKAFCLAREDQFFTPGESETIINYLGWNLQLQICYDLRFPELVRNRILPNQRSAYDAILYVANWPNKRVSHWNTLLNARAIENQCYVLGVNRVGIDQNNHHYSGGSQLISPLGEEEKLTNDKEMIKTVVLKASVLKQIRETLPFLKDR
jgi:predicted amidohydrolase